jgi:type I restriction enzyme S subunit
MSQLTYSKYKACDVSWLGVIPSHWTALRLRHLLAQPISDGPHETPEFTDYGIPFLSVDGIQEGELVFENCRYISEEDHARFSKKAKPRIGDVLMGKAASTGKIAQVKVDIEFNVWSPLAILRPNRQTCTSSFMEYYLKSSGAQYEIERLCTNNTQKNISMADIPRVSVSLPPLDEQRAIADHLDRETARIDALIEEQGRLIELLRERRQAVIRRSIPDPRSSNLIADKLGRNARIGNGSTPRRDERAFWDDGHIPWLNSAVVNQERVTAAEQFVTELARAKCHLPMVPQGSILVALTGQGRTRGTATILDIAATINQHMAYITPDPNVWDAEYLLCSLHAAYDELRAISDETGSTKGALTCEDLKRFRLVHVPLDEQRRIVAYLDEQIAKIDALIAETKTFIELARERRSALITAAVTGQIDVREVA